MPKLTYQDANGVTREVPGISQVRLEDVEEVVIDRATNVAIRDSGYVLVQSCRPVAVIDCDDVQVTSTTRLVVAGHNVWGDPADRLLTDGDVGALLKSKGHG